MCAWAHRLMGEEWASALTRYATHTRRELQRQRERGRGLESAPVYSVEESA